MASGQKLFDAALKRALSAKGGAELLRQAADSLLVSAASGVPWALQMLADRLDGKAAQSVEVTHNRSLSEMSLDELRSQVADILAGAAPERDRPAPEGSRVAH
jgi:hypothetical protein